MAWPEIPSTESTSTRGELVPPAGQRGEVLGERLLQGRFAGRRRRFVNPHVEREDVAHHVEQFVDAMVVDAVLDGRKEAVLAAEAQDVPGIDHRPALDRRVQQVLDRRQLRGRLGQLAALDGQVRRRPAGNASRRSCGPRPPARRPTCRAAASV